MSAEAGLLVRLFYWSALAVGVPSVAGVGVFGSLSLMLWWQRPGPSGTEAKVSESLVNVLVVMVGWVVKVLGAVFGALEGVVRVLTVVSLAGVLFAGLLYVTGRGLALNSMWARAVGSVLMLIILMVSTLGSLTGALGVFRMLPLLMLLLSSYSLWLIWRGLA